MSRAIVYEPPGPVSKAFLECGHFVRGIMGPLGSGKSTACVIELLSRAQEQAPGPDGIRRTRFAVIRNSYPELKTTTLNTWADWCPREYGKLTMDAPIKHHVKTSELDMEVLFLALDRPEDAKKLLSLELTGAWVNEAREIPKAIIDALTGRVGRYPAKKDGGCTWSGIIMDTNPPDDESWWYKTAEENCPTSWKFFFQPSGRSKHAENIHNLPTGYYKRIVDGKEPDWIKVYVDAEYGLLVEGRPVYPMYRDRTHTSQIIIKPSLTLPIMCGVDFGLTPAAVIAQRMADGQWLILDEYCAVDCGIIRFAEDLTRYLVGKYPKHDIQGGWGDPAGSSRSSNDERTAFEILKAYTHKSWDWKPAPSNDFSVRREVVVHSLNRMIDGKPGILVSPNAKMIRKGFVSGYQFKLVKNGNNQQFHETPAKNSYSHPHDALQYLMLGAGEYNVAMRKKVRNANRVVIGKDVDYVSF